MSLQLILATDKQGGIGLGNKLPWRNKEETAFFRSMVRGKTIIISRKTLSEIPFMENLCGRVYVLSRKEEYSTFESITRECDPDEIVWVCGGAEVYKSALKTRKVKKIVLSVVEGLYNCDSFCNIPREEWGIINMSKHDTFTTYTLVPQRHKEDQYLKCLQSVFEEGELRTGRNGVVRSLFNRSLTFDLRQGFPLLTTKKMFFRGITEELLFFLRGDTDSKILEEKNVNIWKGNTSREFLDNNGLAHYKEGIMGPMYGYQWRTYGAGYDGKHGKPLEPGFDQLVNVINRLTDDPGSRRHLMTDFNPVQADEGVLFPCHSLILQFYVQDGFLDMFCYNRSSDLFLGLPFNIASSSLLQHIIAHYTGLIPRMFHLTLGDAHIYSEHLEAVEEQLTRFPFDRLPTLSLVDMPEKIDDIKTTNINLSGYTSHPRISAPMIS